LGLSLKSAAAVLSLMLLVKMRGDPSAYFPSAWTFIADGLLQGGLVS